MKNNQFTISSLSHLKLIVPFLLSCILVQAQTPVITRSNYFKIGDSVLVFHKFDTSLNSLDIGDAGENVLWDFSDLDFNHPSVLSDTVFYIDPTETPFYPITLSADYSQSNLCAFRKTSPTSFDDDDYNYYAANNDSIAFIGHWANNGASSVWEDHCTDFIKELSFPFSFPNHFDNPYVRYFYDMSGSDGHYVNGISSVSADGYGSLITPDGETVNNVLRIHSTLAVRDSNLLFGITNSVQNHYQWFSADKKGFILSFEMDQDNTAIQTASYQKQYSLTNEIKYDNVKAGLINLFPNPNRGIFTLYSLENYKNGCVEIFNTVGERVYTSRISFQYNELAINLSDNDPGIYFIVVNDGKSINTQKVLIEP